MTATDAGSGTAGSISAIADVMALSPLQQGLYSLTAMTDGDDPYVIGMSADITGALDSSLLYDCAAAMLVRHPNLRAGFFQGSLTRPVQASSCEQFSFSPSRATMIPVDDDVPEMSAKLPTCGIHANASSH